MTLPKPLRIALIVVAAVIVLALGAGAVFVATFNPNSLKPRIVQAVKRSTGRDLVLNGKIGLKLSLTPTIRVEDVAFANPAGFSRPQMATLQSMELELGLLPLLSRRIEIERLVLIHPDILLETAKTGQSNWQMTPEVAPGSPSTPSAPAATPSGQPRTSVGISSIRIQDGTLAYRDDSTGKVATLGLPRLEATSSSPDSPLHLEADAVYNAANFNLIADTGSLSRLQDPAATSPWPAKVTLTTAGTKLVADGSMMRPLQGEGYAFAISGTVPDTTALAPLFPGVVLPPLRDVTLSAKIADSGGKLPAFSALTLHAGRSDLNSRVPGLALERLDVSAPKLDQPMKLDAAARLGDKPVTVAATLGPPAQLMPGASSAPFPLDVALQAAGAAASAKGVITNVHAMTGLNIALIARIPDLSALSPLARRPLPALKTVAFTGTLTDAAGGIRNGGALHGFALSSADGDISGDAALGLGTRSSLTATLKSNRIDLDAMQAAIDQMPASAGAPPAATGVPPPAEGGKPPAPPPKTRDDRLFSSQPIPFDLLRLADADLKLDAADLHSGGADYKAINTHLVLANGKLTIDPFAADLPGGHLAGTVSADATQAATPTMHVVLRAPGLSVKTILAAVHEPSYAAGNLEVYADLRGTGDNAHAIAASLDGSLGLAMAGGTIDNRLLGSLIGKVMDSLNALNLVGRGGTSELRCFGLRMEARHGVAAIKPFVLSSSLLTMTGVGSVNLGNETVALALRPQARVAGTGLVIPIAVSGPIRDPAVKVNDLGAAEANAATVAGALIGDATPLGIVGGLLGGDKLFGTGTTDICGPALAAARGQAVPEPERGKPAKPKLPNPETLLKNLFR